VTNRPTIAATDGSSLGNPGPSGWAWVCEDGRQDWASAMHSTNNRMELLAVLQLLRSVIDNPLTIQTDSQYVKNIFTEWLEGWRRRGMRTSSRKPVENQDLILEVDKLLQTRNVTWEWVKGHGGHDLNELADELARFGAERAKLYGESGIMPCAANDPPRQSTHPRTRRSTP
jgi:ribonuclease HI